jgi:Fe-S cluster assembly ATP-binding protein
MAVLDPKLAILDETDSGLDIDALRVVAGGINALRGPDRAIVLVTHYQRLLNYVVPTRSTSFRAEDRSRAAGARARARGEGLRMAEARPHPPRARVRRGSR